MLRVSDAGRVGTMPHQRVIRYLSANDLAAPRLVRRGDAVELVSRRGGVEVRIAGRAMGDGGVNDRVSVENLSSRKIVQGIVGAGGEILVSR
mgnify:CR=1 FL=1